ncbi:MAG: TRAP transporter fused permease subunit [Hyphomicrobiales bacterium]|nr:TRAP transporter fused permease subunit [Hyphomicrobiales bacterium]
MTQPPPALRRLFNVFAGAITLFSIGWALDVPRAAGLVLFVQQYMIFVFGLAMALVYLSIPASRKQADAGRAKVPLLDGAAASLSVLVCTWTSVRFPVLLEDTFYHLNEAFIISLLTLLLIIEGVRRTVGWPLLSVALVIIIYGFFGHYIPGYFNGLYVEYRRLFAYLILDLNALVGVPLIIGSTIVIAFVFFGQLLKYSGGSAFFADLSIGLMGRFRGGASKIAIVASTLFGSISGSAVSNVVSTGVITIPMMIKGGYSPQRAGAIESVASTGGQLMPPVMGAAAFLMAETIQVPYRDVVLAALLPAILYYLAVFIQSDLDAARTGAKPLPASERPALGETLKSGWHFLLPFVILVMALFKYNQPPERAALYAALAPLISGVLLGYRGKKMPLASIWYAIRDTGFAVLDLLMIVAVAGIVIGVLNVSGLSFSLTRVLVLLGGENIFLLLLITAMLGIVLGMGMPTVGVYVLLSVLVAPALIQAGFEPMAAHMFVLYFGLLSMITPPIAIAAFTAASLAKADPMKTGIEAVRYGWSAYIIPFIFIFAPELLLQGEPEWIAFIFVLTVLGVWTISVGASGYMNGMISPLARLCLALAGICMLLPAIHISNWVFWINLAGLAWTVVFVAMRWWLPPGRGGTAEPSLPDASA